VSSLIPDGANRGQSPIPGLTRLDVDATVIRWTTKAATRYWCGGL